MNYHRFYLYGLFFIFGFLGITDISAQSATKDKKVKSALQDVVFYDISGNIISEKTFRSLTEKSIYDFTEIQNAGKFLIKIIKNEKIGTQISSFSLQKLGGGFYNYKPSNGKITILNFWFVGCLPCIREMPALNNSVDKYQDKNTEFIAVTFVLKKPEAMQQLRSFLDKNRFAFEITVHTKQVLDLFNISARYPRTIVLNKEGKIVYYSSFIGNSRDIRASNARLLNNVIEKELDSDSSQSCNKSNKDVF